MSISPGTRVGVYEVVTLLGAGGMGEVYRARDSKLNRDVALKVLPEFFARDPDRLVRFQREAQVLASLNHPNIGGIYGLEESDGVRALVLELVEGPTLADVIARARGSESGSLLQTTAPSSGEARQAVAALSPSERNARARAAGGGAPDALMKVGPRGIPIDEALPIAHQIAEALEAAHEHGIIHRDLKPANIKLRADGTVKVLDFGLAKALSEETAGSDLSQSPTMSVAATRAGVILGTAAYMSPEQARGKAVDKRADIWAFGVVFYEMLTGTRLFQGEDITETLAAVVKEQPDLSGVPVEVRRLLSKCLEKNPKRRLRDIGDAWELMEEAPAPAPVTTPASPRSRLAMMFAVAAGVLAVAFGVALWAPWRTVPASPEPVRFQLLPPEKSSFINVVSVSPDGRKVAFPVRGADNQVLVWVRSLETLEARPLAGTEGAANGLFWSPDNRFIGFAVGRSLKKVEASGGPPQTVCDLPSPFRGGAWSRDGVIIAGTSFTGLVRVPEAGGAPAPLTTLDSSRQDTSHVNPAFLPDGRHFVYSRVSRPENSGTFLGSMDAKPEQQDLKRLLGPGSGAVYASSPDPSIGYLLFERERALMAQPFDTRRLELAGDAAPVGGDLNTGGSPSYSASTTGVLAYRTGSATEASTRLIWFDRQGKQLGQVGAPALYGDVSFADGKRLVVTQADPRTRITHTWTADLPRGVFSRLNPGETLDTSGALSPDGRIAFTFAPAGAAGDIYVRLASGVGQAELLHKSPTVKHPNHWSLDGRFLIYDDHHPTQRTDLWIIPMAAPGPDRKPIPFLVTPADETFGQFSPDGKWVAYDSDETGRREVYVQGFAPDRVPAAAVGKWTISSAGGSRPRWRRDGKEIFYIALDRKMMAVPLKTTATTFEPGVAVPLFDTNGMGFQPYDVAADGRFLINTVTEAATPNALPITVVLNWMTGLKK